MGGGGFSGWKSHTPLSGVFWRFPPPWEKKKGSILVDFFEEFFLRKRLKIQRWKCFLDINTHLFREYNFSNWMNQKRGRGHPSMATCLQGGVPLPEVIPSKPVIWNTKSEHILNLYRIIYWMNHDHEKKSKLQKLWGFEKKITIFAFFCSLIIVLNKQFSIFLADRSSFIRKNPKEHLKKNGDDWFIPAPSITSVRSENVVLRKTRLKFWLLYVTAYVTALCNGL